MAKLFPATVVVADAFWSVTADHAETGCYEGSAGALGLAENVKINTTAIGAGVGTIDFSGSGIEGFICSDRGYSKSGSDLSLDDCIDCLPSGITVTSVKYCSDTDTVQVKAVDNVTPLPITATWEKVSCSGSSSTKFASCTGSDDPAITQDTCYTGKADALGLTETSAGALGLTENVKVNVKAIGIGVGTIDFSGSCIAGFTCSDRGCSKSGLGLSLDDCTDCLPSAITVPSVKYCSDTDTVQVKVVDTVILLPITATLTDTLKKVSCSASSTEFASCTGSDDPVITQETCYTGKAGAFGLTETVTVNLESYSSGAGTLDDSGTGIEAFTCTGKTLTKFDSTGCLPSGITVPAVKVPPRIPKGQKCQETRHGRETLSPLQCTKVNAKTSKLT